MWFADQLGLSSIVAEIEVAARQDPGSVKPAGLLQRLAAEGGSLADWKVG